jgi:hydroxymethylpyrimidine pyrophosphatase-like HAD family hydrolase/fructoselysine-6-P-deglycase FrlB-like protein
VGKPYESELENLKATYEWAFSLPLEASAKRFKPFTLSNLLAIGSGGSYSAAVFSVFLHELLAGLPAKAVTPLEAVQSPANFNEIAALLLAAGGRNPDVLGAFQRLATREPLRLGTLCSRTGSPLQELVRQYQYTDSFDFDLPSGKDGFLATNSLLATVVLLTRLYSEALGLSHGLPKRFNSLSSGGDLGNSKDLWQKETLLVLCSSSTKAAAIDLESKFSEAALGNIQIVDYRNFAHGRHHWLARRAATTGLIAFVADEVRGLADKTLQLLPRSVSTLRLDAGGNGPKAAIAALAMVMRLVGLAGQAMGIDPGQPHVPTFGRKIYHLRAWGKKHDALADIESAAIARKSGATIRMLEERGALGAWQSAYRSYQSQLESHSYRGLVIDYDGTLCSEADRFGDLRPDVSRQLNRLAKSGAMIGVATGRGKSVRKALRDALDKSLWKQVLIGYYNGGDLGSLADDTRPDGREVVSEALKPFADSIRSDKFIQKLATLEFRLPQIKIEPKPQVSAKHLWEYVQQLLCQLNLPGVMLLRSSHAMDVIAPSVSKQAVIDEVRQAIGSESAILCIGDRGRWPGNDFALLSNPNSLSVDEVSPDPAQCWNIAPPGSRGVQAVVYYLEHLVAGKRGFRLKLTAAGRNRK